MDQFEVANWIGLIMAIDKIEETCKMKKQRFDSVELKPIAIRKYIASVSPKIEKELELLRENTYPKMEPPADVKKDIEAVIKDLTFWG